MEVEVHVHVLVVEFVDDGVVLPRDMNVSHVLSDHSLSRKITGILVVPEGGNTLCKEYSGSRNKESGGLCRADYFCSLKFWHYEL